MISLCGAELAGRYMPALTQWGLAVEAAVGAACSLKCIMSQCGSYESSCVSCAQCSQLVQLLCWKGFEC